MGLAHVVLTSVGWQHIVNNTKVQAQGGSANVVFDSLQRVGAGEFSVVLRAIPWITFHVARSEATSAGSGRVAGHPSRTSL